MSVQTPKGAAGQAPAAPTTTAPAGGAQPAHGPQPSLGAQPLAAGVAALSARDFARISGLLYQVCGIHLPSGKEQLVQARLWNRVRALGLNGFGEYVDRVQAEGQGSAELSFMVDALATNKTSFFREPQHFTTLRSELRAARPGRLRIWSAGCSTGEEPYSIAISILEERRGAARHDARILATDISSKVLDRAREAVYDPATVHDMPQAILASHFTAEPRADGPYYRVKPAARGLVRFARLNLMAPWPMQGPFDFIFCRNVMIYFDRPTQEQLIARFRDILRPGGLLFVGHSESLTGKSEGLTYVMPAVYRR